MGINIINKIVLKLNNYREKQKPDERSFNSKFRKRKE